MDTHIHKDTKQFSLCSYSTVIFPMYNTCASQPLFFTLHTKLVLVHICCRYNSNNSNDIILFTQTEFLLVFLSKIHHNEEMFQRKILCRNDAQTYIQYSEEAKALLRI